MCDNHLSCLTIADPARFEESRMPRSLSLLCLALLPLPASADNWDRFRGPNGAGVSNDKDVPVEFGEKNILWKAPIGGTGNASPIIWGDRVFVHLATPDAKERALLCLDATNGKVVWRRAIPGDVPNHSVRKDSSFASSTPTTDGEAVYVSFWDGRDVIVSAFAMGGAPLWSRNLGPFISQHGSGASPVLFKDKLILANDMDQADAKGKPVSRPAVLVALNKKTGDVAWETPRKAFRACYSAPLLRQEPGGPPELIITSTTAITSYNPDDGTTNWEFTDWRFPGKKGPLRTVATPAMVDGMLIASSGDGGGDRLGIGLALSGAGKNTTIKRAWDNQKDLPYVPCAVARGEHFYFVTELGAAACYEARTGKQVWSKRIPDAKFYASPLLIDGKVYAISEQGDVYVFAAEPKYDLLARSSLGERVLATPAIADGKLYVRGGTHLFCIGRAKAE